MRRSGYSQYWKCVNLCIPNIGNAQITHGVNIRSYTELHISVVLYYTWKKSEMRRFTHFQYWECVDLRIPNIGNDVIFAFPLLEMQRFIFFKYGTYPCMWCIILPIITRPRVMRPPHPVCDIVLLVVDSKRHHADLMYIAHTVWVWHTKCVPRVQLTHHVVVRFLFVQIRYACNNSDIAHVIVAATCWLTFNTCITTPTSHPYIDTCRMCITWCPHTTVPSQYTHRWHRMSTHMLSFLLVLILNHVDVHRFK